MAFDHSRRRWFGTCSCKPVPRGLPSSIRQLQTLGLLGPLRSWRTKSAQLYATYLEEFDDNVSWASSAANARFEILTGQPELFESAQLTSSAEALGYRSEQFIAKFGNPARHLFMLIRIGEGLVSSHPEDALNYAPQRASFCAGAMASNERD